MGHSFAEILDKYTAVIISAAVTLAGIVLAQMFGKKKQNADVIVAQAQARKMDAETEKIAGEHIRNEVKELQAEITDLRRRNRELNDQLELQLAQAKQSAILIDKLQRQVNVMNVYLSGNKK